MDSHMVMCAVDSNTVGKENIYSIVLRKREQISAWLTGQMLVTGHSQGCWELYFCRTKLHSSTPACFVVAVGPEIPC